VLFLLLGAYIYRATQAVKSQGDGEDFSLSDVSAYALIVSGLGLLLIPEVVFLNDAYGGENERMNTIFKIYTAAWGMLGLGVAAVLIAVVRRASQPGTPWRILRTGLVAASLIAVIVGTARFHYDVIQKREMPRSAVYGREGLGRVDAEHPGAGTIIRTLRNLPRGTVLEGQGNAYSYTTFVSTLAGQPAYMGWENHLNLLSKVPGEVSRRAEVTSKVYGDLPCSARLDLVRSERIRYIVWGTIERSKYSGITETSFDCFTKVAEEGEYLLLEAR
jgi:uncharacterized membrane protein